MARNIVGCMMCYEIKVMKITIQVNTVTGTRDEMIFLHRLQSLLFGPSRWR